MHYRSLKKKTHPTRQPIVSPCSTNSLNMERVVCRSVAESNATPGPMLNWGASRRGEIFLTPESSPLALKMTVKYQAPRKAVEKNKCLVSVSNFSFLSATLLDIFNRSIFRRSAVQNTFQLSENICVLSICCKTIKVPVTANIVRA